MNLTLHAIPYMCETISMRSAKQQLRIHLQDSSEANARKILPKAQQWKTTAQITTLANLVYTFIYINRQTQVFMIESCFPYGYYIFAPIMGGRNTVGRTQQYVTTPHRKSFSSTHCSHIANHSTYSTAAGISTTSGPTTEFSDGCYIRFSGLIPDRVPF